MKKAVFLIPLLWFCAQINAGTVAAPFSVDSLEFVPQAQFQNLVIRKARVDQVCKDTTADKKLQEFACAASFYYAADWGRAYQAYEKLRGKDSLLDRSIIIRMARSRFQEGMYTQARKALALGKKKYAKDEDWQRAAHGLSLQIVLTDMHIGAKAKVDSISAYLKKYPGADNSTELRYRKAVYLEQSKQLKLAEKAYLQLLSGSEIYSDSALAALRRLQKKRPFSETLDERILYAQKICSKGFSEECIARLDTIAAIDSATAPVRDTAKAVAPKTHQDSIAQRLRPSNLSLDTRISLWVRRARTLQQMNKPDDAIKVYEFLLDSVEINERWLQNIQKLYRAQKRTDDAAKIDSIFMDRYRYSKASADNLWVRGFELEQGSQYDQAIGTYQALLDTNFESNNKREWAPFRIGFLYYKQGNWEKAAEAFAKAKDGTSIWSGSASRMFLGDSYLQMGKKEAARDAYLDCIQDFPVGYYAHRSRSKLLYNRLMDSTQVPYLSPKIISDDSTIAWIRSFQPNARRNDSTENETYYRVSHLLNAGFTEEAFDLYNETAKKKSGRLDFLYQYGMLFYRANEITKSYRLAQQFQTIIDRKHLGEAPLNVLRFLYPTPYSRHVVLYSSSGVDPLFVYSVMRQESTFNFRISSGAGARGLLQIMPATGSMLAQQEGLPTFQASSLYNPYMNIRLGIRYLKDLLQQYKMDPVYVLCNYNAGPAPAKRWQAANTGIDQDVAIEQISYWETREYVKRVLGNYWVYKELWK